MKTIAFLIIALTVSWEGVVGCPVSDDCRQSKVVLDSDILGGQVLTVLSGKRRPSNHALVYLLELRDGKWQSRGMIKTIDRGYFTWLSIPPGDYLVVITVTGYIPANVHVHIRRRHGRPKRIIVPLKTDGCASATLRLSRL